MIKKEVKVLEVLDNTVTYEVTIMTEQKVIFSEPISQISEKLADSLSNMRIQGGSLVATTEEIALLEPNTSVDVEAKSKMRFKLNSMKQSFAASVENLEQDAIVYQAVVDAYNAKNSK